MKSPSRWVRAKKGPGWVRVASASISGASSSVSGSKAMSGPPADKALAVIWLTTARRLTVAPGGVGGAPASTTQTSAAAGISAAKACQTGRRAVGRRGEQGVVGISIARTPVADRQPRLTAGQGAPDRTVERVVDGADSGRLGIQPSHAATRPSTGTAREPERPGRGAQFYRSPRPRPGTPLAAFAPPRPGSCGRSAASARVPGW